MSQNKENNANTEVLQELYHTTKMGMEAAKMLLPKTKEPAFRKAVREQGECYRRFTDQCAAILGQQQSPLKKQGMMEKASLWGSLQMNTMMDDSTSHLAEMMMKGSNMGIVDMTRALNEQKACSGQARDLAQSYLQAEQTHVDNMKQYL